MIKTPEEIREQPYNLPSGFMWSDMDIANDDDVVVLHSILCLGERGLRSSVGELCRG